MSVESINPTGEVATCDVPDCGVRFATDYEPAAQCDQCGAVHCAEHLKEALTRGFVMDKDERGYVWNSCLCCNEVDPAEEIRAL